MSHDLEKELREALRPVDPGEDFTARVLARVSAARLPPGRQLWIPLALAASLAAVLVLGVQWHQRRELRGLEARRELIEALRVTSQKLDLAYRLVNRPHSSGGEGNS